MPNVSDGQANGTNRNISLKSYCQNSNPGIDVSMQDNLETKDGRDQSNRVSSYKSQAKGLC